ncbi:hypothetical protein DL96DRAFT_1617568 [Flagelloscypha sp. PMI_526]|nr:hypothetical protein DL96DRAFT_1617568 [Flagelloscypha sp. PMI_526]
MPNSVNNVIEEPSHSLNVLTYTDLPDKKVDSRNDESKAAGLTQARAWRHKLQKAFLSNHPILIEDLPSLHNLFTTLENYESMTKEELLTSKIGKVMRHIMRIEEDKIPFEEEYQFRKRADALVHIWMCILNTP